MAKYGIPYYGGTKYGDAPKLSYSVEPIELTVLSFNSAYLTWLSPVGNFTEISLVRSQVGIPEIPEDGITIWHEYATQGNVSRNSFTDGVDNPGQSAIASGKEVFYTFFLFTDQKVWVNAGSVAGIVPGDHGMQKTAINLLPRVYTTAEQSPLGEPDPTSDLYRFVGGFSFTREESLTFLDLLREKSINPPAPLISTAFSSVGLTLEPTIPTVQQKRLAREALYMYSHKGTLLGLGTYVESLTGYAPTLTVSSNLMLSPQDGTFLNGIGNWTASNAVISATDEQVPNPGDTVIDNVYSLKIEASAAGQASVGTSNPILQGIPVTEGLEYTISCQHKSPTSAGTIGVSVKWYGHDGALISTSTGTPVASINAWAEASVSATAPTGAIYASVHVDYSAAGAFYIDEVCFQEGTVSAYSEPRSLDVYLSPIRVNFIKNPSFEVDFSNWTIDGATVTGSPDIPLTAYAGLQSAEITAAGPWTFSSNAFPIVQGAYYTGSAYLKSTADVSIGFIGRNSLGEVTEVKDIVNAGTLPEWTRITITDLTDAFSHENVVTYELVVSGDAGTFWVDCAQAEHSFKATEYFDGSLPSQFGAVWSGTANASTTSLYPGKPYRVPRLGYTIDEWLPPNTMWRILSDAGVEYTSEQV